MKIALIIVSPILKGISLKVVELIVDRRLKSPLSSGFLIVRNTTLSLDDTHNSIIVKFIFRALKNACLKRLQ